MTTLTISPFIRDVVLPLFRLMCGKLGGRVGAGKLADQLGCTRRAVYNWLKALEAVGLAKLVGKRWIAVEGAQ